MRPLKLLIVDDDADSRLILQSICKKCGHFDIKQVVDGQEAVDMIPWSPDIILMDVMMPKMNGFEASKIIKSMLPETVILVLSAALDDKVMQNFGRFGIEIYLHKPIDRELIRFKVQSVAATLRLKHGELLALSSKNALNPFNKDIRSFKTIFEILDPDAMMDFGMWLLEQFSGKPHKVSHILDNVIELFYRLMKDGSKNNQTLQIVVEESFDEFYLSIVAKNSIEMSSEMIQKLEGCEIEYQLKNMMFCIRLLKPLDMVTKEVTTEEPLPKDEEERKTIVTETKVEVLPEKVYETVDVSNKEKKTIDAHEKDLLKQSFVDKTTAEDYVREIGGDVLDEIMELKAIDEEWTDQMNIIEQSPTVENITYFADRTLYTYVRVINNLFEFTALAYALSSLSTFLKDSASNIIEDPKKLKTLIMLLEHLLEDLNGWIDHIFILRDAGDIHYLDSSFFSSCMQIEMLIGNKDLVVAGAEDDDDDMEFF